MEAKFNPRSLESNGKPKSLYTFWELKRKPEPKMKVDSQNPREKTCSEESSSTPLNLTFFPTFPASESQVSDD